MERAVDHSAMEVAGYAVPWSAACGQKVELHHSAPVSASKITLYRLDLPEPQIVNWPITIFEHDQPHRSFSQGSYLRVQHEDVTRLGAVSEIEFECLFNPNPGQRTVLAADGLRIELSDRALVAYRGAASITRPIPVPEGVWLTLRLTRGLNACLHIVGQDVLRPLAVSEALALQGDGDVLELLAFGSDGTDERQTLNGRFGRIRLRCARGELCWRIPTRLPRGPILSEGCAHIALEPVNLPTFCVTSSRWDGTSFDPKQVPDHYDAVQCHDDDMAGLDWPASAEVTIPEGAASGIYAFEVALPSGSERIVFFLSATGPTAPFVFLVPTATYLAYADERLPRELYPWQCEDRGHCFAEANGLRSLYDFHNDLSGVSICSYRKPKATLRDDYLYPLCGCPHNLPVDLHFLRFLQRQGIAYDLITDHDLHALGDAALTGHRAVLTGSHPEYMSVEMEATLRRFVARGGHLLYLGGNGFAATVAFRDDLMELRRSPLEYGRTWDGRVAEQSLALTNEPGGFLRHRGRGEFSLVGEAISLMGFDHSRPFVRTPESYDANLTWMFEGIQSKVFGNSGIVMGGAAGYEVDATDPHLGTAADTVVIARAEGFSSAYVHDASRWYAGGEHEAARRGCAEMSFRRLPSGGTIFSAGSVAWCGALPAGDRMNDVGRLLLNLIHRICSDYCWDNGG